MKNQLKSILLTFVLLSVVFITSCGSDDESGPSYAFIDQNLQGIIDGISFESKGGTFSEGFDTGTLSVRIYDVSETDEVCDIFGGESVSIIFSIPETVGLYELFIDLDAFEGQTVTLVNPNGEDGIPQNNIATIGAVEILSVSDTEVKGRMDATLDAQNTVNGNFSLSSCTN